MVERGLQI